MKYSHIALYFLSIFVFFGCSSISSSTNQELSLGVVDFYQPTGLHELFAGKLFPYRTEATKEEEKDLSAILYEELEKKTSYKVQHLSLSHTQGTDETPLEYWSSLGSSQNLDLLIIPQIMEWVKSDSTAPLRHHAVCDMLKVSLTAGRENCGNQTKDLSSFTASPLFFRPSAKAFKSSNEIPFSDIFRVSFAY